MNKWDIETRLLVMATVLVTIFVGLIFLGELRGPTQKVAAKVETADPIFTGNPGNDVLPTKTALE